MHTHVDAWPRAEGDDDVTTSDVISTGEAVSGAFFEPFDRDWYTFTLSELTDVQLSYTNPLYTRGDTWIYLFGSHSVKESTALWDDRHDMEESGVTSGVLSLGAGTYYVEVVPNYNTTEQRYTLCVTEAAQTQTMHRLYNPNTGEHFYTASAAERDDLSRAGWRYEGVGWYSGGGVPVYRQYNPNAASGTHNYTTSLAENDMLTRAGWVPEGIG